MRFRLLPVLLLGACASAPDPAAAPTLEGLEAAAGETFYVELPSNPSTGYVWKLVEIGDAALVEEAGRDFKRPAPSSPSTVGRPGKEVFLFKALRPGKTRLRFEYMREWEREMAVRTRLVDLVIR